MVLDLAYGLEFPGMTRSFSVVGRLVTSLDFGSKTLAGAGGISIFSTGSGSGASIDSGDASGHFQITDDGTIAPTTAGDTADLNLGPYTLEVSYLGGSGSITINVVANKYHVRSKSEIDAVISIGSATIDGSIIEIRPGEDAGGSPGDVILFPATETYTTGLTIQGEDETNPSFLRRLTFRCNGKINFSGGSTTGVYGLVIRDDFILGTDVIGGGICFRAQNDVDLRFDNVLGYCTESMDDTQDFAKNCTNVYSGDGVGGGTVTEIHLDLSTYDIVLSGINPSTTGGAEIALNTTVGALYDPSKVFKITAVDVANETLTIAGTAEDGSTSASAHLISNNVNAVIGNVKSLNFLTLSGGITVNSTIFSGCKLRDLNTALSVKGNTVRVEDSIIEDVLTDFIQLSVDGTETEILFNNLRFDGVWGNANDPQNPHSDGVQINCGGLTQVNSPAYIMRGIIYIGSRGRGDPQLTFSENNPSASDSVLVTMEHCAGISIARNAHTVEIPADGSSIKGNTVLYSAQNGGYTPFIATVSGTYPTQDTSLVEVAYNICSGVSTNLAKEIQNYEFGTAASDNEPADYAALLTGTASDFDPTTYTSYQDFIDAATPDGNTTLWPAYRVRSGAFGGYYNYTTGVADAPWDETGHNISGNFTDQTDVAVGTIITSNRVTLSGMSATGGEFWAEGDGSPQVRLLDGLDTELVAWTADRLLVANGQKVEVRHTSSASEATATNVTVHLGATTDTWTATTISTFSAVAVDSGGSAWAGTDSWSSPPGASKTGTLSFWFYNDATTWDFGPTPFEVRDTAGTPQISVVIQGSGRISITIRNSSGTVLLSAITASSTFSLGIWYHVLFSWDLSANTFDMYLDDVDLGLSPTITNDFVAAIGRVAALSTTTGGAIFDGFMADVFYDGSSYLDLSVTANRRNFIDATGKPVDLTSYGSPHLLLNESVANWQNNTNGSSGALTETGTLVAAASSPSD